MAGAVAVRVPAGRVAGDLDGAGFAARAAGLAGRAVGLVPAFEVVAAGVRFALAALECAALEAAALEAAGLEAAALDVEADREPLPGAAARDLAGFDVVGRRLLIDAVPGVWRAIHSH